ncbi:MAG: hypothetical protein FHP94_14575 [Denitromonas halophila]|nr:MAG: hypothetical protein FHP94_14575 [Denitromonas halophila]TVT71664.1 MAG: hypothetical protein FHP93_09310 [Denitromonas halophila]
MPPEFWGVAIAASILVLILAHWRYLALAFAVLPTLWFVSLLLEIHAPDLAGPIAHEQGRAYYLQAYAAIAMFVVACAAAWRLRK